MPAMSGAVRMSSTGKGNGTKAERRWMPNDRGPACMEDYSFASETMRDIEHERHARESVVSRGTMYMSSILSKKMYIEESGTRNFNVIEALFS